MEDNSTLQINTDVDSRPFTSTINIADGGEFIVGGENDAWSVGNGIRFGSPFVPDVNDVNLPSINLNGGGSTAIVSGAPLTIPAFNVGLNNNTPMEFALNANSGTGVIEADFTQAGGVTTVAGGATLQFDGIVNATGGRIVNNGLVVLNQDSTIGAGVEFLMQNNTASITVGAGANVVFNEAGFDLEGNGNTRNITTVNSGGSLAVNYKTGDAYNHTINLNNGKLDVSSSGPWRINGTGNVNVAGGGTSRLAGSELELFSEVNVAANSVLSIETSGVETSSSTNIDIAAGGRVDLATLTNYNGGTFTGAGTLRGGSSLVSSNTTIDAAVFDMDGTGTGSIHVISSGATLTVSQGRFEETGENTMDDSLFLRGNGSAFIVNSSPSWIMNTSTLTTNTTVTGTAHIGGTSRFILQSTLDAQGDTELNSTFTIDGGTIEIAAGASVILNTPSTPNQINGGTINGPGTLEAMGSSRLTGFGEINSNIRFEGSSTRILAADGTLTITGEIFDVGEIGTADSDGTLNITNQWSTFNTDEVTLNGGEITGFRIINNGDNGIRGKGLITARLINSTVVSAAFDGRLTIDNVDSDWDGTGGGELRAAEGDLEIRGVSEGGGFNGTAVIGNSRELLVNGFDLDFASDSFLELTGGILRSSTTQSLKGDVVVKGSAATLAAPADFFSTATTTLNADLNLLRDAEIAVGASFSGSSALVNQASSTLTLADGIQDTDFGVALVNRGTLVLAGDGSDVEARDFQQEETGVLELTLGGDGFGEFDRLRLDGVASLDGALSLSLVGGYAPTLGEEIVFLTSSGIIGEFADIIQPSMMPAGLEFDVMYQGTFAVLEVVSSALDGDYNNDGTVDAADYTVWRNNLGQAVTLPGDTTPGTVTEADFNIWRSNYGNSGSGLAASSAESQARVPEPATISLLLMASMLFLRRRR